MYKQIKILDHHIIAGKSAIDVFKTLFESGDYKDRRFFLLTDENTHFYCLPILKEYLPEDRKLTEFILPPGEENKNMQSAERIWKFLAEYHADRSSVLVNLGGGMITDTGGFAASVYKRGISFINIPTSLMAMVDAAIGGKTGVNLNNLKNFVGSFAQPDSIYIYPEFLDKLPHKELISGYAEILKYALINDKELWQVLKKQHIENFHSLEDLIMFSVLIKSEIVEADPQEHEKRKFLNFGHTIGHAFESLMHQKENPVNHGEAIAAGLICETYLSHIVNNLSENHLQDIAETIRLNFLDIPLVDSDIPKLLDIMKNDKKNKQDKINCTLLSDISQCHYDQFVPQELLRDALNYYVNG